MQRARIGPARTRPPYTKGPNINSRVGGNHFGQNVNNRFWHCLVVYLDQIAGLRVDLESFVEAKGCFDLVGAYFYLFYSILLSFL